MVRFEMREGGLGPKRKRVTWPWLMVWSSPFPSVHHWSLITQKKKKKTQNLSSNFKPIPHIPQYPFSPLSFFSFPFPSLFLLCVFVYGCGSPISLLHFVSQTLNIFPLSLSLHPLISFPLLKLGFFVSPFQSRLRFYKRYYYNYILEKLYFEQLYH